MQKTYPGKSLMRSGFLLPLLLVLIALIAVLPVTAGAAGDGVFLQQLTLAGGRVVVVAEAALEPRSIGSYSIRLYSGANPDYPLDDFLRGVVHPRNGFVERVQLADVDGDGNEELVVIVRSAGSGSYISAAAFSFEGDNINAVAQVDDLPPQADPLKQLRQ